MAVKWVKKGKGKIYWPSKAMKKRAWVSDEKIYKEANKNPIKFWEKLAKEGITWFKKWKEAYVEKPPYFKWFVGGKLNASFNCLDRHLEKRRNKVAVFWEPEPKEERERVLTYYELYKQVNKFANVLKKLGVRKGNVVGIYLPMIPEAIISMLACARIGAIHTVVFSAFSSEALKIRLQDTDAKFLITADGYYRRGKIINLKEKADEGIKETKVEKVVVVRRLGEKLEASMKEGRDYWWDKLMKKPKDYCKPASMRSEDILFILFSSGTTGRPKGIIHDTGGYLVQAYWTAKWNFDLHEDDVMWCTADLGWITGHTYGCYGILANGATLVMYEGALDWPEPDRWCEIIDKYGVTVFYTAPTAIRMFARYDGRLVKKHDLSSLRILGSVGEVINKEAWLWFFKEVGKGRCPLIDTWWQTETGGTLINALPGIGPFIPCFAGRSFPGTRHEVLDENGKVCKPYQEGNLVQLPPFAPGMLRGLYKNHERYVKTYWSKYGKKIYFTSDGAWKDEKGNFRLTGRVDDVMKVAGHRISTAELEDAITRHYAIAECAIVPMPHEIKGEVPVAFVILKPGFQPSENLEKEVVKQAEKYIGPIARPAKVFFVQDLPKTRSGKIMRRILKKLVAREKELGDLSTLANPESIEKIREILS
ncbi:MAG TPA: acetate--CoA ligase [Candidatus Aenigmarchaeota archaeon]|nr:acetate--CoA ligase [Candidatus Aenigmarchaeota archaeon]